MIKIRAERTAKPGTEGYYTEAYRQLVKTGYGRRFFTNRGGMTPDDALALLKLERLISQEATVDDLWDAMLQAVGVRQGAQEAKSKEQQALERLEAQEMDWSETALHGKRHKGEPKADKPIKVSELFEGDEMTIGGVKVTVARLEFDPDTVEVIRAYLEDGRRWDVKTVGPDLYVYPDKGSLEQKQPSTDFVPPEDTEQGEVKEDDQSQVQGEGGKTPQGP